MNRPNTQTQTLLNPGPTSKIDVPIGAVKYHTTVNELCDLFLNLLPAFTDADLRRLHDVGRTARREFLARTSKTLQRVDVGARRRTTNDAQKNPSSFRQNAAQRQSSDDTSSDDMQMQNVPNLGVIASNRSSQPRKRSLVQKDKERAQT